MSAPRTVSLGPEEVALALSALRYHLDGLVQYQSWLRSKDGSALPGVQTALAEVQAEELAFRRLSLKLSEPGQNDPT